MNGLCPECKNPPQYHSFCTLCCQLFHVPKARKAEATSARWHSPRFQHCVMPWSDPELRAYVANLSAEGLGAGKIAKLLSVPAETVKSAMAYYRLFANPRGPRRKAEATP